jgi:hypothetical protein
VDIVNRNIHILAFLGLPVKKSILGHNSISGLKKLTDEDILTIKTLNNY